MRAAAELRTIAVVGIGALGASWVSLALNQGYAVVAADPAPEAEKALRGVVQAQTGSEPDPTLFRFTTDSTDAVARADLVLEAGPERLEVKRELFAQLDEAADPEVLLASSTSGLLPSSFQDACANHPERMLVAHPFNPPHLMPLVEIVGGSATSPEAIDAAMEIFRHLGKRPIHLRRELPGHVANRLQAALWQEAYHLVSTGAVSAADVDTAIAAGPGLRWSLLGPFATQHLSGGPGGFAHVTEHLGPPTEQWWADLGQTHLTPEVVTALVSSVDEEFAGVDTADLLARRDRALAELLALKATHGLTDGVSGGVSSAVDDSTKDATPTPDLGHPAKGRPNA